MMALTATATERVRADIVKQLKLREPACYVASFNRPNLTYRVIPKAAPYEQVLEFIRSRPNDSGIIYCASRKSAESLARNLSEDGIIAKPYHAGLTSSGAQKIRKRSCAMTFGWSLRQLRLEWASTNQTFASWYITISEKSGELLSGDWARRPGRIAR